MKKFFTFFLTIIIIFLLVMVVSLSMDIHRLEASIGSIEDDNYIVDLQEKTEELRLLQLNMEEEILNVENHLNSYIKSADANSQRLEDLLNKTDVIETEYGMNTSIYKGDQISLNILPLEVDNQGEYIKGQWNRTIRCDNDFTPYLISEIGLVAISRESFIESIESEIEDNSEIPYTFKIVRGRAVQIYQGYLK